MNLKEAIEQGKQTEEKQQIQIYLDQICGHVKASEVHNDLREELGNHLEEMIYDKQQEGFTSEEAAAYAIEQMGDPADLGRRMHKIHRHRMHWGLLAGVAGMATISIIIMWLFVTSIPSQIYDSLFVSHILYMLVGLAVMLFLIHFNYQKWRKAAWWIYILLVGILWINPYISPQTYGVKRLWSIHGISFDLTFVDMWVLPLAIGSIMMDKLRKNYNVQSVTAYFLLLALPVWGFLQASDWVRLTMFGLVSMILFAWITRKWLFTFMASLTGGILIAVQLFINGGYRRLDRLLVVLNLENDMAGVGYSNTSIKSILQSAGWWGNGHPTFDYFQRVYLDYPGVILIDVFGWFAGILLLLGVIWFLLSILQSLIRIRDDFGQMIVLSTTLLFAFQMCYSLIMTTGNVPIISVSFPFIGNGVSSIMNYAMIGLLLGVYRRKDTVPLSNNYTVLSTRGNGQ